ncbi:MAG: heavy metal translocating P-type ATPase metal-binding domain-containing protein [Verrucomicrobiaceae bacterium]|nr:heavy metal translocating P-type ATPase metal-binding domain-containing protein [Verrucomicrobiaceae bacterium]
MELSLAGLEAVVVNLKCKHCSTPIPAARNDEFCCSGCAHVWSLLHETGLSRFYELADSSLGPVSPQALREQDYEWLKPENNSIRVSVQGLSCMACIWLIENLFTRAGGARINADIARGEITFYMGESPVDMIAFARQLQQFGYLLGPARADGSDPASDLARRAGTCGAFAMNAMAFSLPAYFGMPPDFRFAPWFDLIAAGSATMALLVGGSYFASRSIQSLRGGVISIDTPITLGIFAAYIGSIGGWMAGVSGLKYFDFVAMFIFLMLGGRWLQQAAVARNRRKLLRDPSLPDETKARELKSGELFEIAPGQACPVAAELAQSSASISLEWINGESEACTRSIGQMLPSGALNIGTKPISAIALETWERSTLKSLIDARREGDHRDLVLEKLLRYYLIIVILAGVAGGLTWWIQKNDIAGALSVMISIFVVSCPCALGVAMPLADELAASRAAQSGVFVRAVGIWKRLARIQRVIFDKTGTLTLENPALANPEALADLDAEARGALRHLVSGNLHPVSRSLFDAIGPGADPFAGEEVSETAGHGLSFGKWALRRPQDRTSDAEFVRDGLVVARLRFRDELRPESVAEVAQLKARKHSVMILSGDREEKVASIATQLGLGSDEWKHSLTPEEKAAIVADGDAGHRPRTLYIGDGANDSLAFDAASVSGSPVGGRSFLEHKADFYFLGHSMGFVTRLIQLGALHKTAVRRVFAFAVTYNIAAVVAGWHGMLSPLVAAVLMPLSSVVTLSIVALTFAGAKRKQFTQRAASGSDSKLPDYSLGTITT